MACLHKQQQSQFETREKEFASSLVLPCVGIFSPIYGPAVCILPDVLSYIDGGGVRALQQHLLQKLMSCRTVPYFSEYQVSYVRTVMIMMVTYPFLTRLPAIGHLEISNLVSMHLLPFLIKSPQLVFLHCHHPILSELMLLPCFLKLL